MTEPLFCECHHRDDRRAAKLAERDGERIIICDRQHGKRHTLVINIREEYNRLKTLERQESATDNGNA